MPNGIEAPSAAQELSRVRGVRERGAESRRWYRLSDAEEIAEFPAGIVGGCDVCHADFTLALPVQRT